MSLLFANNASTTLASGIGTGATSLTLTSVGNFPTITGTDYFYATIADPGETTWEVVRVTATSGTTLTITRAQDGTTAQTWSTGATIEMRPVAQGMRDMVAQPTGQIPYGDSTGKGLTSNSFFFFNGTSVHIDGTLSLYVGASLYCNNWLSIGYGNASDNQLQVYGSDGAAVTIGPIGSTSIVEFYYKGVNRLRLGATGIGFNGTAPVAKPAITGSRGGNAALASLLTQLASTGLITDSTTA